MCWNPIKRSVSVLCLTQSYEVRFCVGNRLQQPAVCRGGAKGVVSMLSAFRLTASLREWGDLLHFSPLLKKPLCRRLSSAVPFFFLPPQKPLKAQFEADKCKKKLKRNARTSLFIIMTHADGVMIQWMAAEQVINGNLMRFFKKKQNKKLYKCLETHSTG